MLCVFVQMISHNKRSNQIKSKDYKPRLIIINMYNNITLAKSML
jgi:hypothetical protein